ncbi:MAG: hypothetical protein KBC36_06180 [Spirochaetia bacterium]|nr:hypothetical protein [Spirochaetia bacterium]
MDKQGYSLLRQLASDVEGAPYPGSIGKELYTIWYEHVQRTAQEALAYLDEHDPDNRPKTENIDF